MDALGLSWPSCTWRSPLFCSIYLTAMEIAVMSRGSETLRICCQKTLFSFTAKRNDMSTPSDVPTKSPVLNIIMKLKTYILMAVKGFHFYFSAVTTLIVRLKYFHNLHRIELNNILTLIIIIEFLLFTGIYFPYCYPRFMQRIRNITFIF